MIYFLLVLIIIACVLLTMVILVQNPKGGGIASGTLGNQATQFLGARQTTDFLEKATWYFGIGILVIIIISYFFTVNPSTSATTKKTKVSGATDLPGAPAPAAAPASQGAQPAAAPAPSQNPGK